MKLAFACPYYGNTPPVVGQSQRAAIMNAAAQGHEWVADYSTEGLQHRYACESMSNRAAKDESIDAVMWTEHDVVLPPFAVLQLIKAMEETPDADMVTGILFRRCEPYNPIVSFRAPLSREEHAQMLEHVDTCPDPRLKKVLRELTYEEMARDMLSPLRALDTSAPPFQCASTSFGAVLFKRSVFETMTKDPELFAVDARGNFSIDTAFFLRCEKAGLKLYCAPAVLCGHLTDPEVIGPDQFRRHLVGQIEKAEAARTAEIRKEHPEARIYGELTRLANEYGTDKGTAQHLPGSRWADWTHNYTPFYEAVLLPTRLSTKRVMELGVWRGSSLKMWRDFFPRALVYGIDNDPSQVEGDLGERIAVLQADQAKRDQLRAVIDGEFDLIVDDGGHSMEQQQVSLAALFPYVKPGGYYICEDLHSSFLGPEFGVNATGSNSTMHLLERMSEGPEWTSEYMTEDEMRYLRENVEVVWIHGKKSLTAVLRKKA